jgi:predicted short-subunit dehydrogenase-like oxidoreductase (DUF2520 family)
MALKIGIIGCGNVAFHLVKQLQNTTTPINFVFHPDEEKAKSFSQNFPSLILGDESKRVEIDLFICAVSDSAIETVLKEYGKFAPCVSTSGTFDVSSISAIFPLATIYPLQTFNKNTSVEFSKIPLFLECEDEGLKSTLELIVVNLSSKIKFLRAADRQKLHVAAVIANNFSNHFFDLANEFCEKHQLDFSDLIPLIQQSVQQLGSTNPKDLQTGPARRNDQKTIEQHLTLLPADLKTLYKQVSDSITKRFHSHD